MKEYLYQIVAAAFEQCGYANEFAKVSKCKRPEFGDFTIEGALPAAKQYRKSPRDIAQDVAAVLQQQATFKQVRVDGPGYINIQLQGDFLSQRVGALLEDATLGCQSATTQPLQVVIDFGGANVAKPLHVGHLRSAIIGECLKRVARALGHHVIGDVHLGDWGLQMGMLIHELSVRHPEWVYFDTQRTENFPSDSPVSIHDLEELYPTASQKAKDDKAYLEACRQATFELQKGRPGYKALWKHIVHVSIDDLKGGYDALDVDFDLWLGESDANDRLPSIIERFQQEGLTRESDGALIVDVAEEDDKAPMPPVIIQKSDGAILYHATDIATIEQRVHDFCPDVIWYVVDKRQSLHFEQLFRCVRKAKLVKPDMVLTHIPFGTMNGQDGKPFKTRAGGVLKLKDLIDLVTGKALERLEAGNYCADLTPEAKQEVARCVGLSALKFGDLSHQCARDYVFDLEKFLQFEGKTGPYLLYSVVRVQSILREARDKGHTIGSLGIPETSEEHALMLLLLEFPEICARAFDTHEPKELCEYAYALANAFSVLYAKVKILSNTDISRMQSLLGLAQAFAKIMTAVLDILAIPVPEKM